MNRASTILEVRKLSKFFGGVAANTEVDMAVAPCEILGLIGPNGAGKTTFFNVISGFTPPTSGSVILEGRDITGLGGHDVVRLGMARTFQASTLFMRISVLENVFTGFHMSYRTSMWKRLFRTPSALKEEKALRQKAFRSSISWAWLPLWTRRQPISPTAIKRFSESAWPSPRARSSSFSTNR